jgi:hypothetical protein
LQHHWLLPTGQQDNRTTGNIVVFIGRHRVPVAQRGEGAVHEIFVSPERGDLDGEIRVIDIPHFTEALWVHKKGDRYYLSYACYFPEKTCYATSESIHGPWEYQGILNEVAGNSETNHQSIVEFDGKSYFVYHNGSVPPRDGEPSGGRFRRSVCIDRLYYDDDGMLQRVIMTTEGIR